MGHCFIKEENRKGGRKEEERILVYGESVP